jgi:hypothetical protein
MVEGKGWHNEYTRHSEARLNGRASGNKLKSDSNSMKHRVAVVSEQRKFWKEFAKEKAEHPELSNEEVKQIVEDHAKIKSPSVVDIADMEIKPYDKALYFKKQLVEEARKPNPDPQAIKYYSEQFRYWRKKTGKTYFVPVFKK